MRFLTTTIGAILAACLLAAACTVGGSLNQLRSARGGAGASATIFMRSDRRHMVELLALEDTALLVLHRDSVKTVMLARTRRVQVHGYRSMPAPYGGSELRAIRMVCRFPHGASAEIMRPVLEDAGQVEPVLLE